MGDIVRKNTESVNACHWRVGHGLHIPTKQILDRKCLLGLLYKTEKENKKQLKSINFTPFSYFQNIINSRRPSPRDYRVAHTNHEIILKCQHEQLSIIWIMYCI